MYLNYLKDRVVFDTYLNYSYSYRIPERLIAEIEYIISRS